MLNSCRQIESMTTKEDMLENTAHNFELTTCFIWPSTYLRFKKKPSRNVVWATTSICPKAMVYFLNTPQ